ncbi:MAG TPA: hypothetical protein VNI57_08345 [Candidatus Saccharimonadales bacterium]|nr:hypothetical protein [Candidatus Saccharimonadales bacterium]
MTAHDAEKLGRVASLVARVRLGRGLGADCPATAGFFEKILRDAVSVAAAGSEDNVLQLGVETRTLPWLSPVCRQVTVLDDFSEADLVRLEAQARTQGLGNVQFKWWSTGAIAAPQGTADRVLAVNFLYRSRDPEAACREIVWASHHACRVIVCEPSASLDDRTARKYSREADLDMRDHRALVAYARSAAVLRRFSREGLTALLTRSGMTGVEVREELHGLVLLAVARVEF